MNRILQEQYEDTLRQNYALIEQNKKLISRLEIAEKALEEFTRGKFHRSIVNDTWGPMVHIEDAPWEIASKALQQIRS